MTRALLWLGVLGGAGALVYWRSQTGGSDPISGAIVAATDVLTKGARLTVTKTDANGVIPDDPQALADQAVTVYGGDYRVGPWTNLEVYALARMSRSEAGGKAGKRERKARMHIAINQYIKASFAQTLDQLFTYSTNPNERGFFGVQGSATGTRRFSTAQDPYVGDIDLGREVIQERVDGIDPTGGATNFVDKSGFAPGDYDRVVAKWAADGLVPSTIDGLGSDFVVFRPKATA